MPGVEFDFGQRLKEVVIQPPLQAAWLTLNRRCGQRHEACIGLACLGEGLTKYRLAKDIGVAAQRIGEIVSGRRSVTADTDLRLCRYFGMSDGWWLRGQMAYDTAIAKETLAKELACIQRCPLLAA